MIPRHHNPVRHHLVSQDTRKTSRYNEPQRYMRIVSSVVHRHEHFELRYRQLPWIGRIGRQLNHPLPNPEGGYQHLNVQC